MQRKLLFATVCALLPCGTAHANDLFELTNGHDNISFSLPASPYAGARESFAFLISDVPMTINGSTSSDSILMIDSMAKGGISIFLSDEHRLGLNDMGPQLYDSGQYQITSTLFAPTFRLGTFQLSDAAPEFEKYTGDFTVTISAIPDPVATTPESSSLGLCALGLTVLGAAYTKRRTVQ